MVERDRVICVTMSEAEYRAFLAVQPEPVVWLREQIRQQITAAPAAETNQAHAVA